VITTNDTQRIVIGLDVLVHQVVAARLNPLKNGQKKKRNITLGFMTKGDRND
jgi:hypothetical protein